jgi:hypothetical protein
LLDVQIKLGKLEVARETNAKAISIAKKLVAQDSTNNGWKLSLGVSKYWEAVLAESNNVELAANTVSILTKAHVVEPKNESLSRWLSKALVLQCQYSLESGNIDQSMAFALNASEIIEPFWNSNPSERSG